MQFSVRLYGNNLLVSQEGKQATKVLQPGELKFFLHGLADPDFESFGVKAAVSCSHL